MNSLQMKRLSGSVCLLVRCKFLCKLFALGSVNFDKFKKTVRLKNSKALKGTFLQRF